jgi:hypothetical protein
MTEHLRPEEFIDAIDAPLTENEAMAAQARAHLSACEACRQELADLRAVMQETADVSAGAPSPLFWDHFSDRVRGATSALPDREPWWQAWLSPGWLSQGWLRPAAVMGAAVAAVALVIALQPRALAPLGPTDSVVSPIAGVAMTDAADDGTWGFVVGLASELKYSDVKEAAQPVSGTADAVIDELTPAQRTALARLLEKEMGEQ